MQNISLEQVDKRSQVCRTNRVNKLSDLKVTSDEKTDASMRCAALCEVITGRNEKPPTPSNSFFFVVVKSFERYVAVSYVIGGR